MINPTVAVIIPTYNRAHCVGEAIQSVIDQTVPADEIIVIDDGSTDSTADVLAGLGEADTVIRQPNTGVSAARNAGIKHASSEWISFLNSDDIWYPNRLGVFVRDFSRNPAIVSHVSNLRVVIKDFTINWFDIFGV